MKVAHVAEPVQSDPAPEQNQAVVVTLFDNDQTPVFARLEELPSPSFSWCCSVAWKFSIAFVLVNLPFWIAAFFLLIAAGILR